MSVSTYKLYYRRGGSSYSVNLYTSLSDLGSPTHYLPVEVSGSILYAPISLTSDGNDSYLRCRIVDTTYIVKSQYKTIMTQAAFISYVQGYVSNGASRSLTAGAFTLYQSTTASDTSVYRKVHSNITGVLRTDTSSGAISLTNALRFKCTCTIYPAGSTTASSNVVYSTYTANFGDGGIGKSLNNTTPDNWLISIDTPLVWV